MRRICVALGLVMALCATTAQGQSPTDLAVVPYATGFTTPVAIVQDPGNRAVQYVVQQNGVVRVIQSGSVLTTPFLTVSGIAVGGEQGLLGMALAPDYPTSGRFYVNFTNAQGHTVVARFRRSTGNPLVADPASRFDLRWQGAGNPAYITQPASNHNGGNLMFGPDGYLYIGMGDGGGGGDTSNNAQTPTTLLGKMLRVDVSVADNDAIGYRIPANNPFAGTSTRAEIWAFGLRNPWRWSFDEPARGGTGALIIGDVGQGTWEEVDYEPAGRGGRNYGWRVREGAHNYDTSLPPAYTPLTEPIFEYNHSVGASITGGVVYRGSLLPAVYRGRYFFADFITGNVYSILITTNGAGEGQASGGVGHGFSIGNVSAFGANADGELFIVGYSGTIYQVVSTAPGPVRNLRIVRP